MENEIAVIPTGIDIKKFTGKENTGVTKALKLKYDIPEGKTVLLSLGRLGFEKRIDELLYGLKELIQKTGSEMQLSSDSIDGEMEAISQNAGSREDVLLLIVGGGPARESLENLAKNLEIQEHVRFTGMVSPEEIADYYKLGDIFVCASTSETQGLTYIEAMASGLPLVCRKDSCLYGVLEESGNGYAYENLDTFAEEIERLIEQPALRVKMGGHSRNLAEHFGTRKFGNSVESCYYRAIFKRKCEEYESITVCKKQTDGIKEWCRACYAHARRSS